jgi:hypothetical protein
LTLDELAEARDRIFSYKNRSLMLPTSKRGGTKISAKSLKEAVLDGLGACVSDLVKPYIKTFSFKGYEEWSKLITNSSGKKGWLKVFRGGLIFHALRDVFQSIETMGTGGGLHRRMFADFLGEAAEVTKKKALAGHAKSYRALAEQWTEFADAALPNRVAPFKKTKTLLRRRERLFREKGVKARAQMLKANDELTQIQKDMMGSLPLGAPEFEALLLGLRERLDELIVSEHAALDALAKSVA